MDNRLVKTVEFGSYRDVGDPVASSRVYNAQAADELVFLNISREHRSIEPMLRLLERVSEVCFMPLCIGGGITSLAGASALIRSGADKIAINSAVYSDYELVRKIADLFGSQAVVTSIDVRYKQDLDSYVLYSNCGRTEESVSLEEHIARATAHGAGEILVNSIDRDGTMTGYDLDLIRYVAARCKVPIIACGGAGNYNHLKDAFLQTPASGLACGSLFNFGDNNPLRAKAFITNYGVPFKIV